MKLKFNQLETKYTCSLWCYLSNLNTKLEFLPQFHGPLHIKIDSASGGIRVLWTHSCFNFFFHFKWFICLNKILRRSYALSSIEIVLIYLTLFYYELQYPVNPVKGQGTIRPVFGPPIFSFSKFCFEMLIITLKYCLWFEVCLDELQKNNFRKWVRLEG